MTWGYTAVAGATLLGGAMSSSAAGSAQDAQERSAQAGIESQERMFDRQLELQEPYREAGYQALTGLQELTSPEGRATALSDYYGGAEFQNLRDQEEERQLRLGAATGNTRGGAIQPALASITPRLGEQYLDSQYNKFTGVANMGFGAASQGVTGARDLGFQTSSLLQRKGEAEAQESLAKANIWGDAVGTFGGFAMDYFNQPNVGSTKGTV